MDLCFMVAVQALALRVAVVPAGAQTGLCSCALPWTGRDSSQLCVCVYVTSYAEHGV